jgi:hypothetical protein
MLLPEQAGDEIEAAPLVVLHDAFEFKNSCGLHNAFY